jgi:putative ABC transport system permease protein
MRTHPHASAGRTRAGLWSIDPLWRKSPLVLFRYPGLLVPIALGALLLALTAASHPLFIGASGSSLLRDEIANPAITRFGAGLSYGSSRLRLAPEEGGAPLYERRGRAFSSRASRSPHLGPVVAQILGPELDVRGSWETMSTRLFAGTDALDHVQRVEGRPGPGAWLPDLIAHGLGVSPGDAVEIASEGRRIQLPVAGVYASLYARPPAGYWQPWESEIYPYCPPGRDCAPAPPQFIILGRGAAISALRQLDVRTADFEWVAPLANPTSLSRDEAHELAAFVGAVERDARDTKSPLGRTLRCCTEANMYGSVFGPQTRLRSEIGPAIERVETRLLTIEGPARLIQVVGGLVALAVMAGAAAFVASARTTETRLLLAQGRGSLAVGAKAAVESVLPTLMGGVVGIAGAVLLVEALVPNGSVGRRGVEEAVRAAAVAVVASVILGAIVAATVSHVRHGPAGRRASIGRLIPWEVLLLVLAYVLFRDVREHLQRAAASGFEPAPPGASLFLLPIAGIGGAALAGARLFRAGARWARGRGDRMRPPAYLAVRRLADARGMALLLFAASGLAIGIFVHGHTVARSLADSVDAKAGLFVGSDIQAWVAPDTEVPPGFPLPATKVTLVGEAGTLEPHGVPFDLIAIDTATFPRTAEWRDGFSDTPLEELSARLESRSGSPLPAIAVGAASGADAVEIDGRLMTVSAVGEATAFPGMLSHRPALVVESPDLEASGAGGVLDGPEARTELWVRGDPGAAEAALATRGIPPYTTVSVDEVKDIPYISAVIAMFGILDAVGLAGAALALAGLALYLQSRGRSQLVAYGLSTRMGMHGRMHRRSLALETGTILAGSAIIGALVALAIATLLVPQLDPIESVPPDPLLIAPWRAMGATLLGVAVAAWGAAWLTELRSRRAVLGEVLRVDE